jgi:hypothetical protein
MVDLTSIPNSESPPPAPVQIQFTTVVGTFKLAALTRIWLAVDVLAHQSPIKTWLITVGSAALAFTLFFAGTSAKIAPIAKKSVSIRVSKVVFFVVFVIFLPPFNFYSS